jgi:mannose-6-phosphate isomerase-like protein (cupin superfamily)
MVNWALLPTGKAFRAHYHQDMQEVFILLKGNAKMTVDKEQAEITKGDAVVVPIGSAHKMENIGTEDVEYVVFGITEGRGGKTMLV